MKNLTHIQMLVYKDQVVFSICDLVKENISEEEIAEMKEDGLICDRNDLKEDFVYHSYSVSMFVLVDQETGEKVILDRYISQLSNNLVKKIMAITR